jgi:hypothetical protein
MVEMPKEARPSRAEVELGSERYRCWWLEAGDGPVLKCGRCGRGNLVAKKGERCGVCTARVVVL